MVVYTTDDGEFGAVAERIADERGETVTDDLDVAMETEEPVVYVEDPSDVSEYDLLALQKRLLARGPDRGAFSVITGYTAEQAEDLYFTRAETNGEDALLYTRHPPDEVPESPDTNLLVRDEATADNVADLASEPLRSFQIEAGGRPIHITLSEGYICGFPESQRIDDYPEPQPYCVSGNELDCPLTDDIVRAESIDAAHFFLVSCASTINNGTGGFPVHAPTGLLDGADSLLGSYRVALSRPHELLAHHSLLSAGYDVNERCYIMSKHSHVNGIMSFPYISFGRPDAAVADPHEPTFEAEMELGAGVEAGLNDDLHVTVTDVDGYVVDLWIPGEQVPDYDDRLWVRNQTETEYPVYYTVFEEDGGVRLLLYTGQRMQFDELDLRVSPYRTDYVQRAIAFESGKNVKRTAEMGFLTTKAAEQADQLHNQLRTLPERAVDEDFDANAHEEVGQKLSSVHGHVNTIREEILESLTERGDFLYYTYGKNAVGDLAYPSDRDCTICGERPTFIKQVTGWSGGRKRLFSSCPQCGHVYDIPASGKDTDPTYPLVRGKLDADGPRRQPVEIEFTNPTDAPVQATFKPILLHLDNVEKDFFEPERHDEILLPGETHTAEFTIDMTLVPNNMYYILGLVVSNLEVYAGFETTIVGDEAEYYPRQFR